MAIKKWNKLKNSEREKIIETLPAFINGIRDKQFQPYPETYLNNRRWEDEIENNNDIYKTNGKEYTTRFN